MHVRSKLKSDSRTRKKNIREIYLQKPTSHMLEGRCRYMGFYKSKTSLSIKQDDMKLHEYIMYSYHVKYMFVVERSAS